MTKLNKKETRRFLKIVEEDLKHPVGPVPTPKTEKAIKLIMEDSKKLSKQEKSREVEKRIRMLQYTRFDSPDGMIDTQYGFIKYYDWLLKEKDRIDSDINRITEIRNKLGKVALYANQVVFPGNSKLYYSWKKRRNTDSIVQAFMKEDK